MPVPTIAVTCAASDQGGESVAGGIYTAKLDQTEIYDGFVVPEQVTATADADGLAILNLWPNALGVNGSSYRITARNPDTGKKFFDASVVVPNNPCNLYQIIQNAPFPNVDSAQQALIDVQALVTVANQDVVLTQEAAVDAIQARTDVAAWLAQLQFVPPAITSFLIDGQASKVLEIGAGVASVALSWSLAGSEPQSQSINNGIGAIAVGTLARTAAGPFSANQTWTLTVGDTSPNGTPSTTHAAVSLSFLRKRFWGVSAAAVLDSAGVLALGNSELSGSRGKSIAYNATGGRYPYYAYPASLGAIASVTVGGLPFSDFTTAAVNVTNAFGVTEAFNVVRFNSLQNGANIQVVWS